MAKKHAIEIAEYAYTVFSCLTDKDRPPGWVRSKMSAIRAHVGDVYHYLDTEARRDGYAGMHTKPAFMMRKNAWETFEYAEEIANLIDEGEPVPQWVEHKLAVARTYMGDVKHFCEYMHEHGYVGRGFAGDVVNMPWARYPKGYRARARWSASGYQ